MTLEQEGGWTEEEIRAQEDEAYAQMHGNEENGENGSIKRMTKEEREEYRKEKEREFVRRGRSRAAWTMFDDMEFTEMSADAGETGPEHLKSVERRLEGLSALMAAGTTPMYGKILVNRKLAYSDANRITNSASQLEKMAGGTLADTERWMDTPEAVGVKGALLTESLILQGEEVVLKCLGPFTLGFHGWNNLLGTLQSKDRIYDPNDPESDEFFWVFSRGMQEPGDFKEVISIEEVVDELNRLKFSWTWWRGWIILQKGDRIGLL